VDDGTRSTPAARILPHIFERLRAAGVRKEAVSIIFALGTHRKMTPAEITAKIGPDLAASCTLVNTPVHENPRYVFMGDTSRGVPVWALAPVAEADLRIGVGSIVPHCDVGYSGGAKILLPGVCSAETVARNHIMGLDFEGRNYLGAATTLIRDDIENAVRRIGLDFIANTVMTTAGQIYALVCGDFIQAHRAGVPLAESVYGAPARQRVDITLCSSYPGDADFIQVTKAIWAGDKLTCPGGDLIIVTPCTEGMGPYTQMPALMGEDHRRLAARIRSGEIRANFEGVTAALAVRVNRLGERVRLHLVSDGISAETAQQMGIPRHPNIEAALEAAFARQGPDAKVAVMTHGCYTYPIPPGEGR
jgi:nickel-dependent lactate racemase